MAGHYLRAQIQGRQSSPDEPPRFAKKRQHLFSPFRHGRFSYQHHAAGVSPAAIAGGGAMPIPCSPTLVIPVDPAPQKEPFLGDGLTPSRSNGLGMRAPGTMRSWMAAGAVVGSHRRHAATAGGNPDFQPPPPFILRNPSIPRAMPSSGRKVAPQGLRDLWRCCRRRRPRVTFKAAGNLNQAGAGARRRGDASAWAREASPNGPTW